MPVVPPHLLDIPVFLFRTKAEAEARARIGGTGFVVIKPAEGMFFRGMPIGIPYLITNRHVVMSGGASVPSFSRKNNLPPTILELEPDEWTTHPDGEDLAAICVWNKVGTDPVIQPFSYKDIIKEHELTSRGIMVGADILMVGRFINHQGSKRNRAAIRFGNVSMMQEKIWVQADNRYQESFAVEMRSRTGFSGSPVIPYRAVTNGRDHAIFIEGLLGINWGYINDEEGENTWLNGVIPAWKIIELLEADPLKKNHDKIVTDTQASNKSAPSTVQAFAADGSTIAAEKPIEENPNAREDFMRLSGAAARKQKQGD